jgi:hypothetical protein
LKCGAGEGWRRSIGPIVLRNEKVLHGVEEERNILHTIKRNKAILMGRILHRHCLLKQLIEGKVEGGIEVMVRRGIKRKQLLDGFKETRGYWNLK